MDFINKQKFLAELGRLLTFMYEEDRLTALSMYERMFDETADEEGLLQLLVSPTRQAVVLARSYDAKERKLQVQSQSREEGYNADPEDVPSFVFVIDKLAQQAEELGVKLPAVAEGQFSIFDEAETQPAEAEAPAQQEEALPEAELPAEEPAEELPVVDAEEYELPEAEDAEAVIPAEEPEAEEEGSDVDETAAAVDAFLADFSIENGELVSVNTDEEAAEAEVSAAAEEDVEAQAEQAPVEYRQKTNILLLILYIFLAIPVGIVGVAVLLLPTVLCLSLAACSGFVGVSAIGCCFGSFAVIADTMVVFGAGLICLALAVLFVWLFIWFLVGAIVGFIRGLCRLGRKICCKEVAVQ